MNLPNVTEVKGQRVLTTRQLADAYQTDVKVIQNNFQRNKDRYTVGKHYIYMDRDELREVKATCPQIEGELRRTSRAHFWTEKGALLHAKSLNTDKAWEVYDYLVDFYFRAKEKTEPMKEISDWEQPEMSLEEKQEKVQQLPTAPLAQSERDIAPYFRNLLTVLPIEALDEMEKTLRLGTGGAVRLAVTSVLTEKIKRQFI